MHEIQYTFRKAGLQDQAAVWEILQEAIVRRKQDGSNQWQDGYPNPQVVLKDIEAGAGYVLLRAEEIIGYCAVLINDEPAYAGIEGKWLTEGDFLVVHRIAVASKYAGQGLARKILEFIEEVAIAESIFSIKADTNFDNAPMMKTFDKMGYVYCGEVYFRGSPRRAYEKILTPDS